MEAVVMSLLIWIGKNTAYDTSNIPPPKIVEMSPEALTVEAYSDALAMRPENGVDERILALYNFDEGPNGTIFILGADYTDNKAAHDEPAIMDPVFQERLLHELIHHVQRISGAYDIFPCRNYGELEAYDLGGKYLKQTHAIDPIPNRAFWARVYSRC